MDDRETGERIMKYVKTIREVVSSLQSIKEKVQQAKTDCTVAKALGTGIGIVGTGTSILGFLGAPVTGGLSLALTAGGMVTGVAGGVTGGVAEVVDYFKTKSFEDDVKNLQTKVEKADEDYNALFEDITVEDNGEMYKEKASLKMACSATLGAKGAHAPAVFALKSAARAQRAVGKAVKTGQATKAAFTAANATRRTLKAATKALIVVDVVFTVWEIATLAQEWGTRSPTEEEIDGLIQQLKEKISSAERVLYQFIQSVLQRTSECTPDNDSCKNDRWNNENV